MRHHSGFTLIEMLAVFAIALCTLSLFEVAANGSRRSARSMQNNTQLRGIHQACIMYAQGNGSYFPGLGKRGEDAGVAVENRFLILVQNNYFTGEYAISPHETLTAWIGGDGLTTENYSFAMLQLPPNDTETGRRNEWKETLNPDAIVIGDRNTGSVENPKSVHPDDSGWSCAHREAPWRAGMVYNDNHVVIESTHMLATAYTKGHAFVTHTSDHVYDPAGGDDAWLVYSGNGEPPNPLLPTR